MKKTMLILIALSLIILAGCSSRPIGRPIETMPADMQKQTEPATAQTQPTEEIEKPLVEDAFAHSIQSAETVSEYHIPKINLPGETVRQLNNEIYDKYKNTVDFSEENMALNGYPASSGISYEWVIHNDILSLMICDQLGEEFGGTQYETYNISVSAGSLLDRKEVLAVAGLTEDQFLEAAKAALQQHFRAAYDPEFISEGYIANFVEEQLAKTLSEENINNIKLYPDENRQLWIFWREYSLAGADYYWHDMNLTEFYTAFAENRKSAMEQYREVLLTYPEKVLLFTYGSPATDVYADTLYTLYDIDKDGIEELIIQKESTDYYFYSCKDGSAILCGTETWSYSDCLYEFSGNGIAVHDGGMGSMHFEYIELYTLEDCTLSYSTTLESSEDSNVSEKLQAYTNIPTFQSITDLSLLEQ